MNILKSKFFWLNLIAILALIIQQLINNNLLPQYGVYEGIAIAVLNAIAGMIQGNNLMQTKKTLTAYRNKMNQPK